ncbi:AMP-binding protein [Aquirhabdus parva]|nr:AMP-binding protein [Aquirhabdus parva]
MPETTPKLPQTLPELLRNQVILRPRHVALRHKRLGIWQEWTWQDLLSQTQRYASSLASLGFGADSSLLLLSRPRVEALLLALAVQSLGGTVQPLDPDLTHDELQILLKGINPKFIFSEGQAEVDQLIQSQISPQLALYANARGLSHYKFPNLLSIDQFLTSYVELPVIHIKPEAFAFVFYGLDSEGSLIHQKLSHQRLINEAKHLIEQTGLSHKEDALAARAFATAGQARYLVAPWLVAGFRLNFPENLATRDNDRRELSPSLVLGTNATFARVAQLAEQKLPTTGTLTHRIYAWAWNQETHNPLAWILTRLIRRVLRENLGFAHLKTALLIGEPLAKTHVDFYASLGIRIKRLAATGVTQSVPAQASPVETPQSGLQKNKQKSEPNPSNPLLR